MNSAEKRGSVRRRILKGGRIVFNGGRSTIDCTVRNLSDAGALLRVTSILGIPEDFTLLIGATSYACRVVHRREQELGVAFYDAGRDSR